MPSVDELLARSRDLRDLPPPPLRKALREGAGLSQRDVAQALGVSHMAVVHWEIGDRVPSGANLTAYVSFLRRIRDEAFERGGQS